MWVAARRVEVQCVEQRSVQRHAMVFVGCVSWTWKTLKRPNKDITKSAAVRIGVTPGHRITNSVRRRGNITFYCVGSQRRIIPVRRIIETLFHFGEIHLFPFAPVVPPSCAQTVTLELHPLATTHILRPNWFFDGQPWVRLTWVWRTTRPVRMWWSLGWFAVQRTI